jgi:hypothetical protein
MVPLNGEPPSPTVEALQRQVEHLQEMVDELRVVQQGLGQHMIRATATLRVVVELVKGA